MLRSYHLRKGVRGGMWNDSSPELASLYEAVVYRGTVNVSPGYLTSVVDSRNLG